MTAKVLRFSDIKGINEIPTICNFRILENFIIESFYKTKHSHSTDLYDFRFVDYKGRTATLFYGMLEGDNSNISANLANTKSGFELHQELNRFILSAPTRAKKTNKCLVEMATDCVTLIACTCERGTIVGGWHNSQADRDVSLQMLAFCMQAFAALNYVSGAKDTILKEKAVDTIPDDSRFGKYSSKEAETIFLTALITRKDRMRKRAKRSPFPS